jgi:subtilisin family serine protease
MAVERAPRSQILVRVLDVNGRVLEHATVRVDGRLLEYDPRLRGYPTGEVPPGTYLVAADSTGLEAQDRHVNVDARPVEARFVLGKAGLPHYYRGLVKVPYDLPPMVAVVLKPQVDGLSPELVDLARTLGLAPAPIPANAKSRRMAIFRAPADAVDRSIEFEQQAMRAENIVLRAGHVVRYNERSLSFLTNECVVKFQQNVNGRDEARRRKLDVLRELPYSANTFVLRSNSSMPSTELLEICNEWAINGAAIWAEPNLVSTVVAHSPNDQYFAQQLHHPLIRTENAWIVVNSAKSVSNVLIAVPDQGCFTTHEDLQAILSPQRFNFSDNSTVLMEHHHGTKSSGIVAAVVDNTVGTAGIAGFPTFCSLMAVQIPTLFTEEDGSATEGTENDVAAMFLWCAGLDNGRAVPGQLARGADVISNSWTLDGMAASGDVAAALDAVADYGRGGQGCVVVFAAGNRAPNGIDYALEYPLATHRALIAVGASTVQGPEVKVSDSNFGPLIDVCAPGGDGSDAASTFSTSLSETFPTVSDYAHFGRTSAACPQVAGVAALMLAVNPSLDAEEVRNILHSTAVQIDPANPNPIAMYDADQHSQWYGYGRIDAAAAVQAARSAALNTGSGTAPNSPTGLRIITE